MNSSPIPAHYTRDSLIDELRKLEDRAVEYHTAYLDALDKCRHRLLELPPDSEDTPTATHILQDIYETFLMTRLPGRPPVLSEEDLIYLERIRNARSRINGSDLFARDQDILTLSLAWASAWYNDRTHRNDRSDALRAASSAFHAPPRTS